MAKFAATSEVMTQVLFPVMNLEHLLCRISSFGGFLGGRTGGALVMAYWLPSGSR